MTRPSEIIAGIVATVVGAVQVIVGWVTNIEIPPEVTGAITILVGYVAWAVTAIISARQRAGRLPSAPDGAVHS